MDEFPNPTNGWPTLSTRPADAAWLDELGEFALSYATAIAADDPDEMLMSFFDTTHAGAADLADWDRDNLECQHPEGADWWRNRPHVPA